MEETNDASTKEDARVYNLTWRFRQEALCFAADQHDDNKESAAGSHVAQHVLDHLPDCSQKQLNDVARTVHVCHDCGSALHPGWKGTMLRVQRCSSLTLSKRRRTLRRRRQRTRRKQALAKQKEAKKLQSLEHSTKQKSASDVRLVVLKESLDDYLSLDRHHLVVTCGACQGKVRLKGLKKQRQEPARPQQVAKPFRNVPKSTQLIAEKNYLAPRYDLEFVPLPKVSPSLIPPPLGMKPKKKLKNKPPAGKLFDFLSSLND
jgi:hypothetical protein